MASVPENVARGAMKRSKAEEVKEACIEHRSTFFVLSWISLHEMKTSLLKF
jgi:hypothetical protein